MATRTRTPFRRTILVTWTGVYFGGSPPTKASLPSPGAQMKTSLPSPPEAMSKFGKATASLPRSRPPTMTSSPPLPRRVSGPSRPIMTSDFVPPTS